jgi:hypothetical protein
VFVPAAVRPVLILSVLAALVIWAVGEDFGGMLTGRGTDPNSGLLLVLLAAAFWPLTRPGRVRRQDGRAQAAGAEQPSDADAPADVVPVMVSQGQR